MAKISIIVPVYNAEKYLDECVKSIVHQTLSDFELILVDDGSRDQSAQMCDAWMEKDRRIKVIHKENGGPQSAVVEGIKNAESEIVGFCDSDDYVSADYYETLYRAFIDNNVDLVCCKLSVVFGGSETRYNADQTYTVYHKDDLLKEYWENSGIFLPGYNRYTKLFRKSFLMDILEELNPELHIGEDAVQVLLYLERCQMVCCFEHFDGYFYRQVPTSLMNHMDEKHMLNNFQFVQALEDLARKYGHPFKMRDRINDGIMSNLLYRCVASSNSVSLKIQYSKKILAAITEKQSFLTKYLQNLNPVLKAGFKLLEKGYIRLGMLYCTAYIDLVHFIKGKTIK